MNRAYFLYYVSRRYPFVEVDFGFSYVVSAYVWASKKTKNWQTVELKYFAKVPSENKQLKIDQCFFKSFSSFYGRFPAKEVLEFSFNFLC